MYRLQRPLTETNVFFFNILRMAEGMMIQKNNIWNVSHWSLENGYDKSKDASSYPFRVFETIQNGGLEIDLVVDKRDFDGMCQETHYGFFVILTTPGDQPNVLNDWNSPSMQFIFANPHKGDTHFQIAPKIITTSDGLRKYAPNQRKCFHQSERRLRFFKIYTQRNCEAECVANFTEHKCGCVQYSMPSMSSRFFKFLNTYLFNVM